MVADPEPLVAAVFTLLVFGPILAALLIFLWPRARVADSLAILFGVVQLLFLVPLGGLLLERGPQLLALGGNALPLGIPLYLDGLALGMLWLTGLVGLAISIYASGWLRALEHRSGMEYRVVSLLLWSGLNALFLSGDLFNLYVTLEITALASVALVALSRGARPLAAAVRYLYFALIGSIFFLLGVALVYAETGLLALPELARLDDRGPGRLVALAAITAGLAMKAALFPVHAWLPAAHSAAPAPASALLSALVAKASAYLILRLWSGALNGIWTPELAQVLGAMGAAGIVFGSVQALRQNRLKPVIAYSTVAQLGYLLLLMPLASLLAWQGILYHALVHGLAKAALFLAAGNLILGIGHDRLSGLAGCDRVLSKNILAIAIAGVSIAGLPPTGGFVAKWWLINAALDQGQWWWALLIGGGGFLAALYLFRVLSFAMLQPHPESSEPVQVARRNLDRAMLWPPMLLAFAALALGFAGELLAPFLAVGYPGDWP